MKTKDFFTDEFYKNPYLTVSVLNELVQAKQVADQEMYQSGTFLFMEVFNNEQTQKILSRVVLTSWLFTAATLTLQYCRSLKSPRSNITN